MISHEKLLQTLHFRHACKIFDTTKKISDENLHFILEAGRLAPSSFGMEHCKIVAIQNTKIKESLKPLCWNQPQITTCDTLLVLIAKYKEMQNSDYYTKMFSRRVHDKEAKQAYIARYEAYLDNLESIKAWSEKQCYITASNIMNFAALTEIDSCPIEGFEKEKVEKELGIDNTQESIALLIPLGYRLNPQSQKTRLDFEEVVRFLQ